MFVQALHIIAAALAAQLYDDFFTPPIDEDNAVGIIVLEVVLMANWALIGFCAGAGLALVLLLKGTQDEAVSGLCLDGGGTQKRGGRRGRRED